jgi:hypothetical protein
VGYGLTDQIEGWSRNPRCGKPLIGLTKWGYKTGSGYTKALRKGKARRERQRAKFNPECDPEYKRFRGWEW